MLRCKMKNLFAWILCIVLLSSAASAYVLVSPVDGNKYASVNLTLQVNATDFVNCTFRLDDYVAETCAFNASQNFTALFGWNSMEVCGNNATDSICEEFTFWADKTDKSTADYLPFIITLFLAVFLSIYGFVSFGIGGIIGGFLFLVAAFMSLAFFHWILAASLAFLGIFSMIGVLRG